MFCGQIEDFRIIQSEDSILSRVYVVTLCPVFNMDCNIHYALLLLDIGLTNVLTLHFQPSTVKVICIPGRGGGHSGTEGGRTLVMYFAEEGVFF